MPFVSWTVFAAQFTVASNTFSLLQLGQNEPSEEVIEFIQLEQSFSAIQKASSKFVSPISRLSNFQTFCTPSDYVFFISFSQGKDEKKPEKPSVMNPKKSYNICE